MTSAEIKRLAAQIKTELRKELDELMNAKQAAQYLGISQAALRKRCSDGKCPYHKKGGSLYFSKLELNEYYLSE